MIKKISAIASIIFLCSCGTYNKNEVKSMEKIELSNGDSIKCKILTKEEYQRLATSGNSKNLIEYKNNYNIEVLSILNNEVVVNESGYYTLYHNIEDLNKVLNDASNTHDENNGSEILFNKNPYGESFPSHTKELVDKLAADLMINSLNEYIDLDYLKKVATLINERKDPQEFYEQHLLNIIALIGSGIIQKYEAQWEMKLADDKKTWNPYLKIKNQSLNIFVDIYEDIFLNHDVDNAIVLSYQTSVDIIKHNIK